MLKKWLIAACCSVAVCLAVTLWVVPEIKNSRRTAVQPAPSVPVSSGAPDIPLQQSPAPSAESAGPVYLVREFEGSVAVFRFGEETPMQVLETPLSVLPEQDRLLLRDGIPVMTAEELASVLEDYS